MKKKLVSLLLTLALLGTALTVSACGTTAPQTNSKDAAFTDLTADWYCTAVQTCCEAGLMEGKADGRFDPGGTLSYAEIVVIAARTHSLYHGGNGALPSPGAGQPWYQGAVEYLHKELYDRDDLDYDEAYLSEIAESLEYMGNDPCSREDFVIFLSAAVPDSEWTPINQVECLPDVWIDEEFVLPLYNAGILTGVDEYGTFSGDATLTRAETAVMLARVVDKDQRVSFSVKEFSAAKDILGLQPNDTVMTVNGYAVSADLFLYLYMNRMQSCLMDATPFLPELFPEEYTAYVNGPGKDPASRSEEEFEAYLNTEYGVDSEDIDWTRPRGKDQVTPAARLLNMAEQDAAEYGVVLAQSDDVLDDARRQMIDQFEPRATFGFEKEISKTDYIHLMTRNALFQTAPSDAVLQESLDKSDSICAFVVTVDRPGGDGDGYYDADEEAKAEAEEIYQKVKAHLDDAEYIAYVMRDTSFMGAEEMAMSRVLPLDGLTESNRRTLKALPEGRVAPVLTEEYGYLVVYKLAVSDPLNAGAYADLVVEAVDLQVAEWVQTAKITTAAAYDSIDPDRLFTGMSARFPVPKLESWTDW